jgi:PleD family two-component response regulator
VEAEHFDRARFFLQHEVPDVALVDESLFSNSPDTDLAWLASRRDTPVVFLANHCDDRVAAALEGGVRQWVPREAVLASPRLLRAVLEQAAEWGSLHSRLRTAGEALHDCRRQVGRIVNLLWETAPHDPHTRWFTQRHMLARLEEEFARSTRHGTGFSVVLGEVRLRVDSPVRMAEPRLPPWTLERINRAKRRSDVAGRYGPHGFMLLLMNTDEEGAVRCCRRIQDLLDEAAPEVGLPMVAAFGIADRNEERASVKSLLRRAEERLETALGAGAV